MTGPLPPERLEELMVGYVLDELDPQETEEFKQLLAENPQLVQETNRLQEVLTLLPYALPEVEPPSHLRSAILNAASVESNRNRVQRWSRLPWSKIVGSVAALLALALGIDNYLLRQKVKTIASENSHLQRELEIAQAQKNIIPVLLQQPNTRTPSGSIAIERGQQKGVITIQNLPAPPDDRIYRLWAILNNKKIPCTEFRASREGTVSKEFSIPEAACSSANSTLAVTLEPWPSPPPQPVGPVVLLEQS